ncbi:MAG: hypothetical protein CMM26_10320 [Rhodospirillaceae bacterium]|nr:hypothetical protein [Rhodospirillaceae bacterium]
MGQTASDTFFGIAHENRAFADQVVRTIGASATAAGELRRRFGGVGCRAEMLHQLTSCDGADLIGPDQA